jgi:hypothetical protein
LLEELVDLAPHLIAALKAAPVGADPRDEAVAVVDRHDPKLAPGPDPAHEQRFDVVPQRGEQGVRCAQPRPGIGRHGVPGNPERAWIERGRLSGLTAVGHERQVDRHAEARPQPWAQCRAGQLRPALGNQPVVLAARGTAIEQQDAGAAGTMRLAGGEIEQVTMPLGDRRRAQLAALGDRPDRAERFALDQAPETGCRERGHRRLARHWQGHPQRLGTAERGSLGAHHGPVAGVDMLDLRRRLADRRLDRQLQRHG